MNITFENNFTSASGKSINHQNSISSALERNIKFFFIIYMLVMEIISNEVFAVIYKLCVFSLSFIGLISVSHFIQMGNISFLTGFIIALALLGIVALSFRRKNN
ncbi:MAG: hypothetical protein U0M06_01420 [Clostridia bacterium]|nr:hypothetical protein [Clostridia bacterium]